MLSTNAVTGCSTMYLRGLPAELVRKIRVMAAQRGISVKQLVIELLTKAVETKTVVDVLR